MFDYSMFRWSASEHTNLEQRPQPESSVTVVHRSRCHRTPVPACSRPSAARRGNDRALMAAGARSSPPSRSSCGATVRRPSAGQRLSNGWATAEQMVRARFGTAAGPAQRRTPERRAVRGAKSLSVPVSRTEKSGRRDVTRPGWSDGVPTHRAGAVGGFYWGTSALRRTSDQVSVSVQIPQEGP